MTTSLSDSPHYLKYKSVLQDWVMNLSMRKQGVLIAAIRGPDGAPKEDPAKPIHRAIRGVVMNCARFRGPLDMGVALPGDNYMRTDVLVNAAQWKTVTHNFRKNLDAYNTHYVTHLLHATAIIGYNHPEIIVALSFLDFYIAIVHSMHFHHETANDINIRLRDGARPEYDE